MENYSSISTVEPLNFILMPSLEDRALIKIVITLWSQADVISLIEKYFVSGNSYTIFSTRLKWKCIEDKVIETVSILPLPESLKKELLNIIKPVGSELLKGLTYNNKNCNTNIYLPSKLCWTSFGTVDIKKTANLLIKDESLNINIRFATACAYCFDSDVKMLWKNMPKDLTIVCYGEDPLLTYPPYLTKYWVFSMNQTPYDTHQEAFKEAALLGNKIAMEYFLKKMTVKEREDSLASTAEKIVERIYPYIRCNVDILCFLLSQLGEEQQKKVLNSNPCGVLMSFLDWPWQSFFMKTAKHVRDFLSEDGYNRLLEEIVEKGIHGHKDYDYKKLFTTFWQQTPIRYKMTAINTMCNHGFKNLLLKLCKVEDKENIALILNTATLVQKENCFRETVTCNRLDLIGNSNLLRFFVGKCLLSKERVNEFRKEFMECYMRTRDNTWRKLFQLLNDIIQNYDKKKHMDENDDSPAKRLCNTEFRKE